jgi:hypothetical protein
MKALLLVAGVLSLVSLVPGAAQAACLKKQAEVASVLVVPGTGATAASATVFLRHPNSTSPASFSATTTNLNVISAALNAVHTRTKVSITGDAGSCPSGSGSIGAISKFQTD